MALKSKAVITFLTMLLVVILASCDKIELKTSWTIEPNTISFTGPVGDTSPPPKTFTLHNSGLTSNEYTISSNKRWIHISPMAGKLGMGDDEEIKVSVDPCITSGVFTGIISVTGGNNTAFVNVVLECSASGNIATWTFNGCSGQDTSSSDYDLAENLNERCVSGIVGEAATVVSISPELTCLTTPDIIELKTYDYFDFSFWFRLRDINSFSADGTAIFSFGQQNTTGHSFFALWVQPSTDDRSIAEISLRYENSDFGQGSSDGAIYKTPLVRISDDNFHKVAVSVDKIVGTASFSLDGKLIGAIIVDTDFDLLANEPGFLGAHAWWESNNSCSHPYGPRANIDLDEFSISGYSSK